MRWTDGVEQDLRNLGVVDWRANGWKKVFRTGQDPQRVAVPIIIIIIIITRRSGQLHAFIAFIPGKDPRYPLDRRLVGPQSQFKHRGEEKYLLLLLRIEFRFPVRLAGSLVTMLTEISQQDMSK
jgi:hypothetical protein